MKILSERQMTRGEDAITYHLYRDAGEIGLHERVYLAAGKMEISTVTHPSREDAEDELGRLVEIAREMGYQ